MPDCPARKVWRDRGYATRSILRVRRQISQIEALAADYSVGQSVDNHIATILQGADHVIACLDANRIGNLRMMMETAGLPHLCLFKGQLADEAAEAAPWLVRLHAGDKLLRQLLTTALPDRRNPFAFREAEAGIFIHTDMDLVDLQRHFRRFLRVATSDGRHFLFRFWEPSIAAVYFPGLNGRSQLIERWFTTREGGSIRQIVAPLANAVPPEMIMLSPRDLPSEGALPRGQFKLTQGDVRRFQVMRMDRDIARLANRLVETFPQAAAQIDGAGIGEFVRQGVSRMMQFGFIKQSFLFTLLAWDLHYGPRFEARDPQGILARILTSPEPQAERFAQLKQRMEQIG